MGIMRTFTLRSAGLKRGAVRSKNTGFKRFTTSRGQRGDKRRQKKEGIPRGTPSVVLSDCCWKVLFDNYCLGKFLLLFGSVLGQRNGQDAVFDFCADLVFLDVLGQRQHLFELH